MGTYTNSDGLYVQTGTDKATATTAGEFRYDGPLHCIAGSITLASLATGRTILANTTVLPAGVRIEEIEIVNETAATSGGSAVLNLGLVRTDRTTTYDDDGFVAALALTAFDTAGEKTVIRVGSTGAGAFLGTSLANPGLICADYDTAAFTAGVIKYRIYYYKP